MKKITSEQHLIGLTYPQALHCHSIVLCAKKYAEEVRVFDAINQLEEGFGYDIVYTGYLPKVLEFEKQLARFWNDNK